MKKLIFGIFAHPDDEAFGPAAYLYRQASQGNNVHLVVVTDGEAGINSGYDDLAAQRLQEWQEGCRRIGAKGRLALHYADGGLCNDRYLEIAAAIRNYIDHTLSDAGESLRLEVVTFEPGGVTGHLDHIAVSHIARYVYEKLKTDSLQSVTVDRLLYYCLPALLARQCNTDWIYMPAGLDNDQIGLKHVYEDIVDRKIHIAEAHTSQKHDMDKMIAGLRQDDPVRRAACCTDHFVVIR